MRALWVVAIISISLGGCTASIPDTPRAAQGAEGDHGAGQGGIWGLIVDDRFRPLSGAFLLLHEWGLTTHSDGDGEFFFAGLPPGTYKVTAQTDDHEAAPMHVQVEAGTWNDATLVARRTTGEQAWPDRIQREWVFFSECDVNLIVVGFSGDCGFGGGGTGHRVLHDYRELPATWVTTEARFNQDGRYRLVLGGDRECDFSLTGDCRDPQYAGVSATGRYVRAAVGPTTATNDTWYVPFDNLLPVYTLTVVEGSRLPILLGLGVHFAVRAQVIQTVFLGAPSVDPTTYCVLCPS